MPMNKIKNHFDNDFEDYDSLIKKVIPYYDYFLTQTAEIARLYAGEAPKIIDLGCGTGALSQKVLEIIPNAQITCLDISQNMIEKAKIRLENRADFVCADFNECDFEENYNGVISSFALHHLKTTDEKKRIYKNIYKCLKNGGIFVNADVFAPCDNNQQILFSEKWVEYMSKSLDAEEIEKKWIPSSDENDCPESLNTHLKLLEQCGFKYVEAPVKYFGHGIYMGVK